MRIAAVSKAPYKNTPNCDELMFAHLHPAGQAESEFQIMNELCPLNCHVDFSQVESVFEAAYLEARRHRWIESQNAGRDLGDLVLRDWYRRFWWTFLRYRHVEHLLGERAWLEFTGRSFAVLQTSPQWENPLTQEIIELYRNGWENLNIVAHALQRDYPMDEVRECLATINMNDARLNPQFH